MVDTRVFIYCYEWSFLTYVFFHACDTVFYLFMCIFDCYITFCLSGAEIWVFGGYRAKFVANLWAIECAMLRQFVFVFLLILDVIVFTCTSRNLGWTVILFLYTHASPKLLEFPPYL